jgi:hypothetical protein
MTGRFVNEQAQSNGGEGLWKKWVLFCKEERKELFMTKLEKAIKEPQVAVVTQDIISNNLQLCRSCT